MSAPPGAAATPVSADPDPLDDLRFVEEPIGSPEATDGGESPGGAVEEQSLSFDTDLPVFRAPDPPDPNEPTTPDIARPTPGGTTIGEAEGAPEPGADPLDSAADGSTADRIEARDAQFDWSFDSEATAERSQRSQRDWGSTLELDAELTVPDPGQRGDVSSLEAGDGDRRCDEVRPKADPGAQTPTRTRADGDGGRTSPAASRQDAVDRTLASFLDGSADGAPSTGVPPRPDPLGDPQSWDFLAPRRDALPEAGDEDGAGPGDGHASVGGSPSPAPDALASDPMDAGAPERPSVLARRWARVREVAWGEWAGSMLVVLLIAASAQGLWVRRAAAPAPDPVVPQAAALAALEVAELEARSLPTAFAGHLWVVRGSLRNATGSARRIATRVGVEPVGDGSPVEAGVGIPLDRLRTLRPAELDAWRREASERLPELVLQPGERTRFQALVRAGEDALAGFRLTARDVVVGDPDLIGPRLAHPTREAARR